MLRTSFVSGDTIDCHEDPYEEPLQFNLSILSERIEPFPKVTELFVSIGNFNLPNIFLEDWTDESYYNHHGIYLEDAAGTGIHRIIENHPPCLKINGKPYSKGSNIFNYPKSMEDIPVDIELIFTDCYINEMKLQIIYFENVGPKVIRYEWIRIPNYENNSFPIKFPPSQEQKFYIDSRPGVLLPGEKRNFEVGQKSEYTGVYKEDWEFITVPTIHTNKTIFKFRAITTEKVIKRPWNILKKELYSLESKECAVEIINYILMKMFEALPDLSEPDLVLLEDEDEVFLYVNKDLYSYDQYVVNELKEMYKTIFDERWSLNMAEFEDLLIKSDHITQYLDLYKFKKLKIQMMKSDIYLLPKPKYKKYVEVFEIIGETITEVQSSIEKCRQKHGFKPLPPIPPSENLPYYYFPLPQSEIQALPVKEDPVPTKKTAAPSKTADKGKGAKGKKVKQEFISLVPQVSWTVQKTEWAPENQEYADDVYDAVYANLGKGMERIEQSLNPEIHISSGSIDASSLTV